MESIPPNRLSQISTRQQVLADTAQFFLRYGPALRRYLTVLLNSADTAEEVLQDLFVRLIEKGLPDPDQLRGRFRDYLRVMVRNAGLAYLRTRQPSQLSAEIEANLATPEADWVAEWRRCLLDRAWRNLEQQEQRQPLSHCYSVLRLTADQPDADVNTLLGALAQRTGHAIKAEAFRQQRTRARRLFVEILVQEVAATLEMPTLANVNAELSELGLLAYLRDYLPET
jgi:RNA polymerase sigma factor (sigma-70 family)